jgi:hypothetical protein
MIGVGMDVTLRVVSGSTTGISIAGVISDVGITVTFGAGRAAVRFWSVLLSAETMPTLSSTRIRTIPIIFKIRNFDSGPFHLDDS